MSRVYYEKKRQKSGMMRSYTQISTLCEKKCIWSLAICVMMCQKSAALKRMLR